MANSNKIYFNLNVPRETLTKHHLKNVNVTSPD